MPFSIHCATRASKSAHKSYGFVSLFRRSPNSDTIVVSLTSVHRFMFFFSSFHIFNWPPICIRCNEFRCVNNWPSLLARLRFSSSNRSQQQHSKQKKHKISRASWVWASWSARCQPVSPGHGYSCSRIQKHSQLVYVFFMQIMLNRYIICLYLRIYRLETIYRNATIFFV